MRNRNTSLEYRDLWPSSFEPGCFAANDPVLPSCSLPLQPECITGKTRAQPKLLYLKHRADIRSYSGRAGVTKPGSPHRLQSMEWSLANSEEPPRGRTSDPGYELQRQGVVPRRAKEERLAQPGRAQRRHHRA